MATHGFCSHLTARAPAENHSGLGVNDQTRLARLAQVETNVESVNQSWLGVLDENNRFIGFGYLTVVAGPALVFP